MPYAEFFVFVCNMKDLMQSWQTMTASWLFALPDHKYAEAVKLDMSEFTVSVTECLSLMEGIIDSSIKVDNRSMQASILKEKRTMIEATYVALKQTAMCMMGTDVDGDDVEVDELKGASSSTSQSDVPLKRRRSA